MPVGRKLPLSALFSAGVTFLKMLPRLVVVKRPLAVLWSYVRQTPPPYVDLRSGHRIFLSSHPHDIRTFCVVFLKRDYGNIQSGEVVFDVGANIGSFSIYAALSGAKKVYAFEPSIEAFEILSKNVSFNRLESVIVPVNKAVSDLSGEVVKFPRQSSPYNSLVMTASPDSKLHVDRFSGELREHALAAANSPDSEFHEVLTVSLGDFIAEQGIPFIDLLKMDCEGAEFSIVPALTEETIHRIRKIRMECHGDPAVLLGSFCNDAYLVEQSNRDDLWLVQRSEPLPSDVNYSAGDMKTLRGDLLQGRNQ